MVFRLLAGTLSGADLETALTTDAALYLGPWREVLKAREFNALLNSSVALTAMLSSETCFIQLLDFVGQELAASDQITEIISNTSSLIKAVVTNTSYLNLWQNTPANKTRLLARVNASGSKLKRWVFTANGTWDIEALPDGLAAYSFFICGAGGAGGNSQAGIGSGRGGSGSEAKWGQITSGLPVSNQSITVGASGNTVIGSALHEALAGISGSVFGTANNFGPGTTSGTAIFDSDPQNAVWQSSTGTRQGGYGGGAVQAAAPGFAGGIGEAGISGSGGTCASPGSGGTGGTGLCSGGAAGGCEASSGGVPGGNASGYGTGGGGAALRGVSTSSGGNPGGGLVVIYGVAA